VSGDALGGGTNWGQGRCGWFLIAQVSQNLINDVSVFNAAVRRPDNNSDGPAAHSADFYVNLVTLGLGRTAQGEGCQSGNEVHCADGRPFETHLGGAIPVGCLEGIDNLAGELSDRRGVATAIR
jgi:hypothetical protein